ncbi:MAG: tRNA methyl transferase PRC-barrel domain-containing protein, partial [Atribacterota bacterium]
AEKPASQEICFVRGKSYRELIEQRTSAQVSGLIVDGAGKPVGRHEGVYHFTVGQRKGMGIGFGKRQYIIDIHPEKNEVVIGEQEELDVKGFTATGVNLFVEHLPPESSVKTRYSHDEKPCYVEFQSNTVVVHFPHPQRFVSPGQVGVFYEGDRVIGAAPITALIR